MGAAVSVSVHETLLKGLVRSNLLCMLYDTHCEAIIFQIFLMNYFRPFYRGLDELDKPIDGDDEDIDSIEAARAKVRNQCNERSLIYYDIKYTFTRCRFAVCAALSKGQ